MRGDRFEMKRIYEQDGCSCTEIAKIFGITRQSAHETLTRVGTVFRKNKLLPFILYGGRKWTISKSTGYYRDTLERKTHLSLHCFVWEQNNGCIPNGYDVHHIDFNKENNDISNLECIPKALHTSLYSPHHNQYKNNETIKNGKWTKE